MSTSRGPKKPPSDAGADFKAWLEGEFEDEGSFTALVVLVEIGEITVTPQASTFVNVIGTEVAWSDLLALFEGAGCAWDGVAFFPSRDADGSPLDNAAARRGLTELVARLGEDRLVLNEGRFFDRWGRRMRIDEVTAQ